MKNLERENMIILIKHVMADLRRFEKGTFVTRYGSGRPKLDIEAAMTAVRTAIALAAWAGVEAEIADNELFKYLLDKYAKKCQNYLASL